MKVVASVCWCEGKEIVVCKSLGLGVLGWKRDDLYAMKSSSPLSISHSERKNLMGVARLRKVTTAWHEAGHIVVGMHFGFRLMQATITPLHTDDGTSLGHTEWAPIGGTFDAMPLICIALAGGIAEEKWSGTAGRWHGDDFANIWALAWLHLASTETFTPHASLLIRLTAAYRHQPQRVPTKVRALADEIIVKAAPETRRILNAHWSQVEHVAGLLLRHTVLTPELMGIANEPR